MSPEQQLQKLLDDLEAIEREVLGAPSDDVPEIRRILGERKAALLESASEGPDRFNEWAIKRLERRHRRFAAALVAVAVVSVASVAWALVSDGSPAGEPAASEAQVEALTGEVRELRRTMDGRLEALQKRVERGDANSAALSRELTALRRCTSRGIVALDRGLRGLLNGSVSANAYVARGRLSRC